MVAPFNFDAVWHWLPYEAVTYYRREPDDTFDAGTLVDHAVLVNVQRTPSGSDPRLPRREAWWAMPQTEADGATPRRPPKKGDVIEQAGGTRWQVDRCTVHPFRTAYEIHGYEEVTA